LVNAGGSLVDIGVHFQAKSLRMHTISEGEGNYWFIYPYHNYVSQLSLSYYWSRCWNRMQSTAGAISLAIVKLVVILILDGVAMAARDPVTVAVAIAVRVTGGAVPVPIFVP
jgi:hypothetical protein